jgi:hypothetical protein
MTELLKSPVPEATQVLGHMRVWCPERQPGCPERQPASALGSSQAKSSGAVNQQQATGQSQARRCRVEQAAGQAASRGDARAGQRARTGGAKKKSPPIRSTDVVKNTLTDLFGAL